MTYGFFVRNITSATVTPETFRGARIITIVQVRSWSGSAIVSSFDSSSGFFIARMNSNSYQTPRLTWNNTSKVLTWEVGGGGNINDFTWSRNFDVFFFFSRAAI
jgi:hypothetical protein